MDRKIGLVLASIHAGLSRRIWRQVAFLSESRGDTLFVFPGGRLSCPENYEYLRQIVYPLASSANLQGLISWSSTLGGFVPLADVVSFHQKISVPLVSFGLEIPGHPSVGFDSYHGLVEVVSHLLEVHGSRHVAFLRGPQSHPGAQERYEGFLQCMKDHGIAPEEKLISSPYPWSGGREAMRELLDGRHLVPGKDFDTLVSSSDMMGFDAGRVLEERGFRVPQDVRMVGFNDSQESLSLRCPLTTEHVPVDELCALAYGKLDALVDHRPLQEEDTVLPMRLVVRSSCGCPHPFGNEVEDMGEDFPPFLTWLKHKFPSSLVERLVHLAPSSPEVDEVLYTYLKEYEGNSLLAEEAISLYGRLFHDEQRVHLLEVSLMRAKFRLDNEERYQTQRRRELFNTMKNHLLCSCTMKDIVPICREGLLSLGVRGMGLVLHDASDSLFVGGFLENRSFFEKLHFPTEKLLPEEVSASLPIGTYVVEPLFMENQPLGYVVLLVEPSLCEGVFLEELRTALSSSVKGALLFEEACKAKEMAERSERLRSVFLANVSANIRKPFSELMAEASSSRQKEKMLRIMHLFELALSHVDVDEMSYQLTSYASLPPVFVQEETMERIFDAIAEYMAPCEVQKRFAATREGLKIAIMAKEGKRDGTKRKDALGVALAERLCLNQAGTLTFDEQKVTILLPWPTLHSSCPQPLSPRGGRIWFLGEEGANLPGLLEDENLVTPQEIVTNPAMVGGCALLEVDAGIHSYSMQLAIHMLEKLDAMQKIPVVCLHYPEGCQTVIEALYKGDSLADSYTIALLGTLPAGLEKLALPGDFCHFHDLSSFESLCARQKPALCVMDHVDKDLIVSLRAKSQVPMLVVQENFSMEEIDAISHIPGLTIANTCIAQSTDFLHRIQEIVGGAEMLAPLTGVLVKRGIAYLGAHATEPISRWQLAEAINVSEDYLTRIFRKELGLSPWDYLTRIRINIAKKLLRTTTLTIGEVANQSGFQDQAYFCRVFKKATGMNPGKIRQR